MKPTRAVLWYSPAPDLHHGRTCLSAQNKVLAQYIINHSPARILQERLPAY